LEINLIRIPFLNRKKNKRQQTRGQSFVELALVLPVLLLMFLGMVEVALFIGRYLDVLDLTREAARFASVRDPFANTGDLNCSTTSTSSPPDPLNFFYDTSCMLSPPAGSSMCTEAKFCNGFNPYIVLDPATDDVVITAFTALESAVNVQWPLPNHYWAWSNVDFTNNVDLNLNADPGHPDNFKKDCQGNVVRSEPYYTAARVASQLIDSNDPTNPNLEKGKGFIAVEVYYCYHQVLGLPLLTDFVPNPVQIHAYTFMPLPAAQPTPTTIP
jgi:hypothetical protein